MRTLITEIQDRLQEDTDLAHITDTNIFISVDPDILPNGVTFPAIGVKDSDIEFLMEEAETWESTYYVDIIIYVALTANDDCILGDGAGSNPHGIKAPFTEQSG